MKVSISKHAEFNSVLRNKYVRETVSSGKDLGLLINLAMALTDMRGTGRRALALAEKSLPFANPQEQLRDDRRGQVVKQSELDMLWIAASVLAVDCEVLRRELATERQRADRLSNELSSYREGEHTEPLSSRPEASKFHN